MADELVPAPVTQSTTGALSVVLSVTVVGPPEEAEALAQAALKAARVLTPVIKIG